MPNVDGEFLKKFNYDPIVCGLAIRAKKCVCCMEIKIKSSQIPIKMLHTLRKNEQILFHIFW